MDAVGRVTEQKAGDAATQIGAVRGNVIQHVRQRLVLSLVMSLVAFALIAWLAGNPEFFTALGVNAPPSPVAIPGFRSRLPPARLSVPAMAPPALMVKPCPAVAAVVFRSSPQVRAAVAVIARFLLGAVVVGV